MQLAKELWKPAILVGSLCGGAHVYDKFKRQIELPEFGEDFDDEDVGFLLNEDYVLTITLYRVYTLINRDENHSEVLSAKFEDIFSGSILFLILIRKNAHAKKINKIYEKLSKKLRRFSENFTNKDHFTRTVLEQEIEKIEDALNAHLHNFMIQKFF